MEATSIRGKAEYRSSLRSKALIREALLELLKEKNFETITITDIVKKADINRGTFYAHFRDTYDVLDQVVESIIDDLILELNKYTPKEIVKYPERALTTISAFFDKNFSFYKSVLSIDGIQRATENGRQKARQYLLRATKTEGDPNFESVFDMIVAGIADVYIDSILGNINVTLFQIPSILAPMLDCILRESECKIDE